MSDHKWNRFWCLRGGTITLDTDGYAQDPECEKVLRRHSVVDFDELRSAPCLVLLGEPGIGKSTAVREAFRLATQSVSADGDIAKLFDLALYGQESRLISDIFEGPDVAAWRAGAHKLHMFIDSLDESLLRIAPVAAILLDKIGALPLDRLYLRIACRTGDWPRLLEEELSKLWQSHEVVYAELAPLRRTDVALAAKHVGVDVDAFLSEVDRLGAVPLALKPITLNFLLKAYKAHGALPNTKVSIYQDGCIRLCEEKNSGRVAARATGILEPAQRCAIAARIAAVMMFCRRGLVRIESEDTVAIDELALTDLVGGTEIANGVPFAVTATALLETFASTGLFSSRGPGCMGWAHQTYAEYLAARYLSAREIPRSQLKTLVMHHDDQSRVIPQLQEVAGWLASMNSNIFAWLAGTDPQVLLTGDSAPSESDRRALVHSLLESFAAGKALHAWGASGHYRKLCHSSLTEQVAPYIDDSSLNQVVRRAAIDIALSCELRDLQGNLTRLALDASEDEPLRVFAAHAIGKVGDPDARRELLPLVLGSGAVDIGDELRAMVLEVACPALIPCGEVFALLASPKERGVFGAYYSFIHRLGRMISKADLPRALQWVAEQPRPDVMGVFDSLLEAVMRLGWDHAEDPAIAASMVPAVRRRLSYYGNLRGVRHPSELDASELPTDARRCVLQAYVQTATSETSLDASLVHSRPPLLMQADVPWVIARFEAATGPLRALWASIVVILFRREQDAIRLNFMLTAAELYPELSAALKAELGPIELASDEAHALRVQAAQFEELTARHAPLLLSPTPMERVLKCLADIERGIWNSWSELLQQLTLEPTSTHYRHWWQIEPTQLPGWVASDDSARKRILEAAKRFIREGDPENAVWIGSESYQVTALAGHRALLLLVQLASSWLNEIAPSVWERWTPIIIAYTPFESQRAHQGLVATAYAMNPPGFLVALAMLIRAEDPARHRLTCCQHVDHCWDERLSEFLLNRAAESARSAAGVVGLLEQGMRHGDKRFAELAAEQLPLLIQREREHGVAIAVSMLTYAPDICWATLWSSFGADASFGRDVVSRVGGRLLRDIGGLAERLSADQLAELYLWMEMQFPRAQDPRRGEMQLSSRESTGWFRDALLQYLQNAGTVEARTAINRIAAALPDHPLLPWTLLLAHEASLMKTWVPLVPCELLRLTRNQEERLVVSGQHLMAVIGESIGRLEAAFQGETPQARDVWDRSGAGYVPNDENSFSDHVKRHLDRELRERGIVLNREVEIRRSVGAGSGERTDIHVDAVRRSGSSKYESVKVIIEVKGCWNKDVRTAMETQLRDRYLRDNSCRHGLYLVAWFDRARWNERDARRQGVPWQSIAEARTDLEKQAALLSTSDVVLGALVVDASLH